MTEADARALTRKILALATVPEVQVQLEVARRAHLRFARNAASTSGSAEMTTVTVTAWKGKRKATVSAAVTGDEPALRKLVEEAESLAEDIASAVRASLT